MIQACYRVVTSPGAAPRVALGMLSASNLELRGGDGRSRIACVVHGSSALAVEAVVTLLAQHAEVEGVFPDGE